MARLQTKILLVLSLTGLATTIGFGAFLINSKMIEASYGVNENLKPVAYIEGSNVQYSSIEKALEVANTLAQSGTVQNVYVIPGTNPTISRQCIVGSNVNLILPYEGTTYYNEITGSSSEYNGANFADNNPNTFRKNSVKVSHLTNENGSTIPTIIVNSGGTISIGGYRGYNIQGGTSGRYCELVLEDNALIQCDGKIDCHGYIKETRDNNGSMIEIRNNGVISEPLVIYDWGSASDIYSNYLADVFPFNLFDLPQVSPVIRLYSGCILEGKAWIYGTQAGDNIFNVNIVGDSSVDALIKSNSQNQYTFVELKTTDSNSNTTISKTTNNHKMKIDVYGHYYLDGLVVDMTVLGFIPVHIDSREFELPLSNIFDINLKEGATFDINSRIKFLPGSKVKIDKLATANLDASVSVYKSNKNSDNLQIYKYTNSTPSTFINEGMLNINSTFGGKIEAGSNGDTSSFIKTSSNLAGTSTEDIYAIGGTLSKSDTITFSYNPTADIKIASDIEGYKNDVFLESNQTYTYGKEDNQYYWVADGYVVNFTIEDTTTSNNQTILTPNYNVEITRVKDGTVETISNPNYVRVYDGDIIKIVPLDDNIDEILIDGVVANDKLNTPIEINNSSLDVTIKPKVIEASEIANVVIEWSSNGTSWSSNDYYDDAATLYLRANITTVNGDSYYSPLTTFEWNVDGTVLSDTSSSISYPFSDDNKTYNVSLTVTDGLNQTEHTDSLVVETTCITGDTLVLMTDYTYKEVRYLNIGDKVICYDHEKGQLIENTIMANIHLNEKEKRCRKVIVLEFDNGANINIVMEHGLFDLTLNKYVMINNDTYLDYVDHDFAYLDINTKQFISVKLIKASIELKEIDVYSPVTIYHLNHIANNFLAFPGDLPGFYNQFTFKNLKYDEELMKQDIQKYGLLSYEDLCKEVMLPYEVYQVFPLLYYRIAVEKELTTFDELRRIVKAYLSEFLSKFNK